MLTSLFSLFCVTGEFQPRQSPIFILISSRCPHCQQLSPELDAAADHLATKNQFVFAKVRCALQ